MLKLYIYDKWVLMPENWKRPFKTIKRPIFMQQIDGVSLNKIVGVWYSKRGRKIERNAKILLLLRGKLGGCDYENAFIGNRTECWQYLNDCLIDIGIMSKARARKRVK